MCNQLLFFRVKRCSPQKLGSFDNSIKTGLLYPMLKALLQPRMTRRY
jgi:hypothetical protein